MYLLALQRYRRSAALSRLLEADEVIGVCPCIAEHHINEGVLDVIYCTVVEAGEGVIGVQGGWLHHARSPQAGLPHQHPSLVHVLQPLGVRVRVRVVARVPGLLGKIGSVAVNSSCGEMQRNYNTNNGTMIILRKIEQI